MLIGVLRDLEELVIDVLFARGLPGLVDSKALLACPACSTATVGHTELEIIPAKVAVAEVKLNTLTIGPATALDNDLVVDLQPELVIDVAHEGDLAVLIKNLAAVHDGVIVSPRWLGLVLGMAGTEWIEA